MESKESQDGKIILEIIILVKLWCDGIRDYRSDIKSKTKEDANNSMKKEL